jgi:hypothetical protein
MGRDAHVRWAVAAVLAATLWLVPRASATVSSAAPDATPALPLTLSATGLYRDLPERVLARGILGFTPQYPLWSDGTRKQRWLWLPPGSRIDARRGDAWQFPTGTRLWKEFSLDRPVETRLIERLADGRWRFATYVWRADGSDADLAPEGGIAGLPVASAPKGRYRILARRDCRACHDAAPSPVLGVSALQLSPDRDPGAAHAVPPRPGDVDMVGLHAMGRLRALDRGLLRRPPRIPARTPTERSALGYLHGNCGHCHNRDGAEPRLPLDLVLAQSTHPPGKDAVGQLLRTSLRYRRPGAERLLVPGDPAHSVLALRVSSSDAVTRMPPLGTTLVDQVGVELIHRWIGELPSRGPATAVVPEGEKP